MVLQRASPPAHLPSLSFLKGLYHSIAAPRSHEPSITSLGTQQDPTPAAAHRSVIPCVYMPHCVSWCAGTLERLPCLHANAWSDHTWAPLCYFCVPRCSHHPRPFICQPCPSLPQRCGNSPSLLVPGFVLQVQLQMVIRIWLRILGSCLLLRDHSAGLVWF